MEHESLSEGGHTVHRLSTREQRRARRALFRQLIAAAFAIVIASATRR